MTEWQPNPGHMPVAPEDLVVVHLALFETPAERTEHLAGKLIWGKHGPGQIARWRHA